MSESSVVAELDRLYWNTDLTVGDIAELVGLPATGLNRHASPLPADVRCYLCRNELAFTSRSQRSEQRVRCYACGCSRRAGTHRHHRSIDWRDLRPGGSLIVVRQSEHDIGYSIEACLDALARGGSGWDEESIVVLTDTQHNADDIVAAVNEFKPGILAIPSLRDLGSTQTECLQTLFRLTQQCWRVVSGSDVEVRTPIDAHGIRRAASDDASFDPDSFDPDSFDDAPFDPDSYDPDSFDPDSFDPDSFDPDWFERVLTDEHRFGRPGPLSDRLINATARSAHRGTITPW